MMDVPTWYSVTNLLNSSLGDLSGKSILVLLNNIKSTLELHQLTSKSGISSSHVIVLGARVIIDFAI
jgi:hypothetical protein